MISVEKTVQTNDATHNVSDRVFGLVLSGIFSTLAILPLIFGYEAKITLLMVAAGLFGVGLLCPILLKWPKTIWFAITQKIALVVNWILLGIIFYGVVTPVGLFFRLIGRDPLHRKWDSKSHSYWVKRSGEMSATSDMKNQF